MTNETTTKNTLEPIEEEEQTTTVEVLDANDAASLGQLYGDQQEITAMAKAIKAVAPWANDSRFPLSNHDIGLVIRRCRSLGVDPLNPKEIHVWKDKQGLHTQLAYPLLRQWIQEIHGGHTNPTFHLLDEEELYEEGLAPTDHAVRASFIMFSDFDRLRDLVDTGFTLSEARELLTRTGVGTATEFDWDQQYFAPNARSKLWKLKKRALTDAYRSYFGTPSRQEIILLRRSRGEYQLAPSDFDHIAQDLLPHQQRLIAHRKAAERNGELIFDETAQALPSNRNRDRDQLFKA